MAMTKTKELQSLGLRVLKARREAQLTQEDVSERVGISQQNLSGIERGRQEPRALTLALLSKTLRVSADELLGLTATS